MKYNVLEMSKRALNHSSVNSNNISTRTILVFAVFVLIVFQAQSQTQISGVINSYAKVNSIDYNDNSVTITSASAFNIGDKVILIQMQGANIDASQSSSFGNITAMNDAGNYEIQTICDIQGNEIIFAYDLLNTYDANSSVQLVRIPLYTNAIISGDHLIAGAWNGLTGGVVALEVLGNLDLGNYNIDVSGRGFRGADYEIASGNCSFLLDNSYYKTLSSSDDKASKGEGISIWVSGKECGRGPQANGGGGGNNHNGGGGGGANYGAGGRGGERIKSSTFTCGSYYGLTSKNLVNGYTNGKLFMGGGGGAGHVNNTGHVGENGTNGGGIVIIIANSISGNNKSILANGTAPAGNAVNDGGGGGGAGGTVILDVNSFSSNLNIDVSGGNGASVINTGSSNCNGPGGGGGGGIVLFKNSSASANVTVNANGGLAGKIVSEAQSNCSVGNTNNASNGSTGTSLYNSSTNESIINTTVCSFAPLPIELIYFNAGVENNVRVKLEWATQSEINNSYFEVERSHDRSNWNVIDKIPGAGNSNTQIEYISYDYEPLNGISYYRLKQVDYNGSFTYSETVQVNFIGIEVVNLFPNPSPGSIQLTLNSTDNTKALVRLIMLNGKTVYNRQIELQEGFVNYELDFNYLPKGMYIFHIEIPERNFNYQTKLNLVD